MGRGGRDPLTFLIARAGGPRSALASGRVAELACADLCELLPAGASVTLRSTRKRYGLTEIEVIAPSGEDVTALVGLAISNAVGCRGLLRPTAEGTRPLLRELAVQLHSRADALAASTDSCARLGRRSEAKTATRSEDLMPYLPPMADETLEPRSEGTTHDPL